jgi:hypothetical protein
MKDKIYMTVGKGLECKNTWWRTNQSKYGNFLKINFGDMIGCHVVVMVSRSACFGIVGM